MDIRLYTAIIIEKDGQYLVGYDAVGDAPKWSNSPYDAWKTRARDKAYIICHKVGGKRYLFNSVAGQLREMQI